MILNHRKNEKKKFESNLQSAGIYDWLDGVLNFFGELSILSFCNLYIIAL